MLQTVFILGVQAHSKVVSQLESFFTAEGQSSTSLQRTRTRAQAHMHMHTHAHAYAHTLAHAHTHAHTASSVALTSAAMSIQTCSAARHHGLSQQAIQTSFNRVQVTSAQKGSPSHSSRPRPVTEAFVLNALKSYTNVPVFRQWTVGWG